MEFNFTMRNTRCMGKRALLLFLLFNPFRSWAFTPQDTVNSAVSHTIKTLRGISSLFATSSRELRTREEGERKARGARAALAKAKPKIPTQKKGTKNVLTLRLQQATARVKAAAMEADYANKRQQIPDNSRVVGRPLLSTLKNMTNHPVMGTLSQLTKIIDRELRSASDGTALFNVHGTTNPPPGVARDSMRSLLEENDAQSTCLERKSNHANATDKVRHIAIVISKPLIQDQVTLEYACRLRALAKAIQGDCYNETFRPSMVCFLGGTSMGNLVADADAGYVYFNHLCAANQISLEGIDVMLEKTTLGQGALKHILRHLRQEYIPEWIKEQQQSEEIQSTIPIKTKVQIHFSFFSCDYDLCRLNDIQHRSPQQSILRPLLELEENDSKTLDRPDDRVQTTWSYRYSTYPYVHFKDAVTSFLGKCYLLAQELTVVLVNIRGVVDGTEFFQRDNFRALVSIRRSFVADMERFYQCQPSLKITLRKYVSHSDYPLDIVLEGALLSLGRCLDLVRPAGLLIGYVPKTDWKNAEIVLEHAVRQLRDACDPDHPLDPADWGKLDHNYGQPDEELSSPHKLQFSDVVGDNGTLFGP